VQAIVIDDERDSSAEFSQLYVRLLNAVLDERNSSLSPQQREHYLAAHVAQGISTAGVNSASSQGFGREEPTLP
jgi:hypothetical protein